LERGIVTGMAVREQNTTESSCPVLHNTNPSQFNVNMDFPNLCKFIKQGNFFIFDIYRLTEKTMCNFYKI
jgi:hypothetical protein